MAYAEESSSLSIRSVSHAGLQPTISEDLDADRPAYDCLDEELPEIELAVVEYDAEADLRDRAARCSCKTKLSGEAACGHGSCEHIGSQAFAAS